MSSFHVRIMRLPEKKSMRFLELYARESVLYNTTLDEYMDPHARLAAASRFSEEMNIPTFEPKEVIAKFKNLRSSYSAVEEDCGQQKNGAD